jgi:TolA-binding protein
VGPARAERARRRAARLAGFRAAFPHSPRDAEALAELAASTARAGDCVAARPLLEEYLARYATAASAAALRAWRARCAP